MQSSEEAVEPSALKPARRARLPVIDRLRGLVILMELESGLIQLLNGRHNGQVDTVAQFLNWTSLAHPSSHCRRQPFTEGSHRAIKLSPCL